MKTRGKGAWYDAVMTRKYKNRIASTRKENQVEKQ
jgi:hypothetical protein